MGMHPSILSSLILADNNRTCEPGPNKSFPSLPALSRSCRGVGTDSGFHGQAERVVAGVTEEKDWEDHEWIMEQTFAVGG
jgi:hypothetical protein